MPVHFVVSTPQSICFEKDSLLFIVPAEGLVTIKVLLEGVELLNVAVTVVAVFINT